MTVTTEVPAMADAENETNEFRAWMKSLGYNSKQVSTAGDLVGMSASLAGHSSRGLRELTKTERMAMAAATAGLPEWTPETSSELDAMRTVYTLFKAELANASKVPDQEVTAIKTIQAVIRSEALRIATNAKQVELASQGTREAFQTILELLRAAGQETNEPESRS